MRPSNTGAPHPVNRNPDAEAQLMDLPEGWQAATQLQKLRRTLPDHMRKVVEERAIDAILDRARHLLRHAARPTHKVTDCFPGEGELDLPATLDNPQPWKPGDVVVERIEPREADVVAVLDMSLSMTGDKVALTALATAILRLKFERLGVICFDTVAHRLVRLGEPPSARELVRRVLTVPAQGYTNIEAGLTMAAGELSRARHRERVAILMSDGIANVGRDPATVAGRIPTLHVVQVGAEERQGTQACQRMASAGRGRRYRAHSYEELPGVVRRLVRECFRGA